MKVHFFDWVNTLLDVSGVDQDVVRLYSGHMHDCYVSNRYIPMPFAVAEGMRKAVFFPWVAEAIERLRAANICCVALTNLPFDTVQYLMHRDGISFNGIYTPECCRMYKPDPGMYICAMRAWNVIPSDCVMISANLGFGDHEVCHALGMYTIWLNREGIPIGRKTKEELRSVNGIVTSL